MNIVLVGYRGTGKSSVSKVLSRRLKRKLVSIDERIARSAGMSIPEIVRQFGWPKFRELESEAVQKTCEETRNCIIDCGGGVVMDPGNVEALKRHGKVVWLTASFNTIMKRIRHDPNRPPLKEGLSFEEEQKQVLAEREACYQAAADIVCDTTNVNSRETVQEILDHFKKNLWL